jgi:hypothetical protein
MIFPQTSAEDFASWVATNKPYLIEIEEHIQKIGLYGEMEIKLSVRGGRVEKVQFWQGTTWMREKALTQSPSSVNK